MGHFTRSNCIHDVCADGSRPNDLYAIQGCVSELESDIPLHTRKSHTRSTTIAQSSVSAPLHILVNMSFQWYGSEENGDPIGLRRLGGGTFGVVYLHTGVRGLVYLLTPGLIPYRSSLEFLKSVAQSMDAKLSGTNTVSFSRFIKHSAPLGMPSSRQSLPSSTHQLT